MPTKRLYGIVGKDDLRDSNGRWLLPEVIPQAIWPRVVQSVGLTPRQSEVAWWICRGCSNNEIARRLQRSPDTIRMHTRALFLKLDIHDRVGVPVVLVHQAQRLAEQDQSHTETGTLYKSAS